MLRSTVRCCWSWTTCTGATFRRCAGSRTSCHGSRGSTSRCSSPLRSGEPGEDPELVGRILTDPLATVIRPAPLTSEAAASVVREALSSAADDDFCEACRQETGGNPLLLRELVRVVATEGLVPTSGNIAG